MDRVVLVVETERVHRDVDSHPDRQLALRLASRGDLEGVGAGLVTLPGAGEVVLRVDHRAPGAEVHRPELGMEEEASRRGVEQVEALEHHVGGGHRIQCGPGQHPGQIAAEGGVEPSPGGAVVGVGEEEPAEDQVAAKALHLRRAQWGVLPVTTEVEEGVVEEPGVGEGQRTGLGHHLHRRSSLDLPGQPAHARHPAVPAPPVLRHRGDEPGPVPETQRPRPQGEEGKAAQQRSPGKGM